MSSLSVGLFHFFKPNHAYESIYIELNERTETRNSYREKLKTASFKSNGNIFCFLFANASASRKFLFLQNCTRGRFVGACFAYDCLP
jgi:hypothetical protein